jgi:hypothetical protein
VAGGGSGSLREYDKIADRIKQHRQARPNSVAVVEGDSDERIINRTVSSEIDVFRAGTRDVVVDVARSLRRFKLARIVCIVDRDFDDLVEEAESEGLQLVAYDGADLESMLVMTSAFDGLLDEVASAEKLTAFGGVDAVRSKLIELVIPMAAMRRENAVLRHGVKFDGVKLQDRLKPKDLRLNYDSVVDALRIARSDARTAMRDAAAKGEARACPVSGLPMFRGKDALAVLSAFLWAAIATNPKADVAPNLLIKSLRLGARRVDVRHTRWFNSVETALQVA